MMMWQRHTLSFKKIIVICLLILGVIIAAYGLQWQYFLQNPFTLYQQAIFYTIKPGQSLAAIADELHQQGIVAKPRYLTILGRLRGDANHLKAGTYLLTPGLMPSDFLTMVREGRVANFPLRIGEGWDLQETLTAIKTAPYMVSTLKDVTNSELAALLGRKEITIEGLLFPDTYTYPVGTSDVEYLRIALKKMDKIIAEEWAQRANGLPYKTPYEALIMASIIEKETGLASERAMVAGVFVRRLQRGMPLQADPTVAYGVSPEFSGRLTKADLLRDTPYNTYTRFGLPITPIAMPSLASLRAALHPDDSNSLYFVAKGDGTHYFSSNLVEHNKAVVEYILRR